MRTRFPVFFALSMLGVAWAGTPSRTPLSPLQLVQQLLAVQEFDNQDYSDALPIFAALAAIGDARSETDLGQMYDSGWGVDPDEKRALRLQQLSAAQGYSKGENRLGDMYRDAKDYPEALYWLRLAAAQGETSSMCQMGNLYESGLGVTRDYALAMQWFQRSAKDGDDCGYDAIGFLYDQGLGVPVDEVRALQWWIVPARHGDDTGENNIGALYHRGVGGLPLDYGKAAYWFKLAAAQGNATAEANLAVLTTDGLGVRQSDAAAFQLDELAAAQDEPHAEEHLGSIYRLGRATPVDYVKSAQYYARAAEHGLSQSQAALSYLLENGLGVKRDQVSAYQWYLISVTVKLHPIMVDDVRCREYSELPVSDLADMFKDLTPAQKAVARTRADAWLAAHPASVQGEEPVKVQGFL